jgi:hypothetical protein
MTLRNTRGAANVLIKFLSAVALLLCGCGARTTPGLFETRLNAYITAVPNRDLQALKELWISLADDVQTAPGRGDAKLYALKSDVARELAFLESLNGKNANPVEQNQYMTASLRDGSVAYLLSEWSEQAPDWIKPAVYNITGDLLTMEGLLLDRQNAQSQTFSDSQRKENFTRAAMYHLGALAFHLQSKAVTVELLKTAKEPSPGLKAQATKSDERILETLTRAINDLGDVLSSPLRLEVVAEAENGQSRVFLSHFNFSAQTHYLTGFLLSEKATPIIEKKDRKGCLGISGLAARHHAVALFLARNENNEYDASLREAVTRFIGCLDL